MRDEDKVYEDQVYEDQVYETYWTTDRGNVPMAPSYGLLDLTVYGRQEFWEDSLAGWPQRWRAQGGQFQLKVARPPNGRGCRQGIPTTWEPAGFEACPLKQVQCACLQSIGCAFG